MATSDGTIPCSLCIVKNKTHISKSWCLECKDALCSGCTEHHSISNATRNHNTVPIEDYIKLPSFILNLKLECDVHNEKFHYYCKNHESPLCKKCITTTHKECKDIAVLDDVMSGIKQSFTLESIQHETETVRRIIKGMRDDRENNYHRIRQRKNEIIKEISEVRGLINQHLDKIQDDLLQELESETKKQKEITDFVINKLNEKENRISEIQENLSKIIKYASDFQTFLGVKQIEKLVHTEEEYVRLASDDGSLNQIDICCDINKEIQEMTKHISSLGNINIKTTPAMIDLKTLRKNRTQLHVINKTTTNAKRLKLMRRIDILKSRNIDLTCCCLKYYIWGITYKDGHVIYCAEDEGVGMVNLQTSKTTMLLKEKLTIPSFITTFGRNNEKFAFSVREKRIVRVFDSDMKEIWRVGDTNYLQEPMCIFVDTENCIYLLDMRCSSVVYISPGCKEHSVLQCNDCTFEASTMSFNDKLRQLLVYTKEKELMIFQV